MANILKVNEQNSIQQLAEKGWSRRRIARELNLDRKTVRRYLKAMPFRNCPKILMRCEKYRKYNMLIISILHLYFCA